MIKELWTNGTDFIMKYTEEGRPGDWFAASHWPRRCGDLSPEWLNKIGYRLMKGGKPNGAYREAKDWT